MCPKHRIMYLTTFCIWSVLKKSGCPTGNLQPMYMLKNTVFMGLVWLFKEVLLFKFPSCCQESHCCTSFSALHTGHLLKCPSGLTQIMQAQSQHSPQTPLSIFDFVELPTTNQAGSVGATTRCHNL